MHYCVVTLLPGGARVSESEGERGTKIEIAIEREREGRREGDIETERERGGPSSMTRGPRRRPPEPGPRVTVSADPANAYQGTVRVLRHNGCLHHCVVALLPGGPRVREGSKIEIAIDREREGEREGDREGERGRKRGQAHRPWQVVRGRAHQS